MADEVMETWSLLGGFGEVTLSPAASAVLTGAELWGLPPEQISYGGGFDEIPVGVGLGAGAGMITPPSVPSQPLPVPVSALVPAATSALAALGVPAGVVGAVGAIGGLAAGAYGIAQAFGLGEGEGLFGLDLLGGDTQYVNGIPIGGPGLAEPGKNILIKEWHVKYDWGTLQYYLVVKPGTKSRYIMLYNTRTKRWKSWPWRSPHLAVIGKNMPRHQMLTRLRRNLKRHAADARTILTLTGGTRRQTRHHYTRRK